MPDLDPELPLDDIQGNVMVGFNKDHQWFVSLRIGDLDRVRPWLRSMADEVSTSAEVLRHNRAFVADRRALGREPAVSAVWTHLALTYPALLRLRSDAVHFRDEAFRAGLSGRSEFIGDPSDPAAEGHASNWLFGGPHNTPDILIIVAGDEAHRVEARVEQLRGTFVTAGLSEVGSPVLGVNREDFPGAEHFGFQGRDHSARRARTRFGGVGRFPERAPVAPKRSLIPPFRRPRTTSRCSGSVRVRLADTTGHLRWGRPRRGWRRVLGPQRLFPGPPATAPTCQAVLGFHGR